MLPTAAIIGRTNVGKSTLFNRLAEENKALVSKIPGTTRDCNYANITWRGNTFQLIDTGGLDVEIVNEIDDKVLKKVQEIFRKANLVLFILDIQQGILPQEKEVANTLRKLKKDVILVLNKADGPKWRAEAPLYLKLGLGEPEIVSALNGVGTGDLLDVVVKKLKNENVAQVASPAITALKLAIIGKPNVGKSSLFNSIIGEERVIVSPIPHTTRDMQDTEIDYKGEKIVLIDTAGLRRRARVTRENIIEKFSVEKTLETIKKSDINILVLEINLPLTAQDLRLAHLILENQKALIIVANKWDLIPEKKSGSETKYIKYIRASLPNALFSPIIFTSATQNLRTKKILDVALEIKQEMDKRIEKESLDQLLKESIKRYKIYNKRFTGSQITELTQKESKLPHFNLHLGGKQKLPQAFYGFLEKRIREKFQFLGLPIIISTEQYETHRGSGKSRRRI